MKICIITYLCVFFVTISCSSKKNIERRVSVGNYNQAISEALRKLGTNKDKSRKEDYILLLKEAFIKAEDRDLNTIYQYKKDGNPAYFNEIYKTYVNLHRRQETVKPVIPLIVKGKEVDFKFTDYADALTNYRHKASEYLYNEALLNLNSQNKFQIRDAYKQFDYIESINPNFKDIRNRKQEAHFKGTDFVIVSIKNRTQQIIPKRLETDLLNFDTYGLDQFWVEYHSKKVAKVNYDYAMKLQLQEIFVSPEEIREREIIREKQVVDGWEYLLDKEGNSVKDSLGNNIKIDKFKTISCQYLEFEQFKSAQVSAKVMYTNLKSNQLLESFPIQSNFIFNNKYATIYGDKRALEDIELSYLNNSILPFPTNEQMVYDAGEELKLQLKEILLSYNFN